MNTNEIKPIKAWANIDSNGSINIHSIHTSLEKCLHPFITRSPIEIEIRPVPTDNQEKGSANLSAEECLEWLATNKVELGKYVGKKEYFIGRTDYCPNKEYVLGIGSSPMEAIQNAMKQQEKLE